MAKKQLKNIHEFIIFWIIHIWSNDRYNQPKRIHHLLFLQTLYAKATYIEEKKTAHKKQKLFSPDISHPLNTV